jgi:hypothetical protein
MTDTQWYYHQYGPYVEGIIDSVRQDADFTVNKLLDHQGNVKEFVVLNNQSKAANINVRDKQILDHVIKATCELGFSDFIRLVYSTYPVISSDKHTSLDLVTLAHEYRKHMFQEAVSAY